MKMALLAALTAVLLPVGALLAEPQTVVLNSGQQLIGEVTQTEDGLRIETAAGGVVVLPLSQVREVRPYVSPEQEFLRRRAELAADDVAAHLDLARWAREQGLLEHARAQLQYVLELQPDSQTARLLLDVVESQIQAAAMQPDGQPQVTDTQAAGLPLLTQAQVERIRLEELRSSDRVAIRFDNRAIDRFLEALAARGGMDRSFEAEFRRAGPVRQAVHMVITLQEDATLAANLEGILNDIHVLADPAALQTFRTRVWPWVAQSCATAACHGGVQGAGSLRLFSLPPSSDPGMYTNFYVLDQYRSALGEMIDRDRPAESLLLQFGLPDETARARHPVVDIPPLFRDRNDRTHELIEAWIGRELLKTPDPGNYGIQYDPAAQPQPRAQPGPALPVQPMQPAPGGPPAQPQ